MVRLDLRYLIAPFSLLKASNTFRSLEQGEELEIWCHDAGNIADLIRIVSPDACQLVSMENLIGSETGLKALLKKTNHTV